MRVLLALLCTLTMVSFAKAESKVAIVDLQKAIQTTNDGKKIKADLEGDFNKKKKELEGKEADLKKMRDELDKKKSVLSEAALQKKQQEFQGELEKYRDSVSKSQSDLQKKQQEMAAPMLDKMKVIIADLAKSKGYSIVLQDNPAILYSISGDDITDEVIAAYDKKK